jgi:hypothetical protein
MEKFEEFKVKGSELLEKVLELIREGNIRHLIIKNKNRVFLEIPFTLLTVAALLAPYLVAIGLFGTLVTDCSVEVVRKK